MVSREAIVLRLLEAMPGARVELEDLTGTEDHWSAVVASAAFAGKSRIEQHQMVYRALGSWVGTAIHALELRTVVANGDAHETSETRGRTSHE